MPVWLMTPPVVASPYSCAAASRSAHVAPPPQRARRAAGSTVTVRMAPRLIIRPSSPTDVPAKLWPPPRTAISSSRSRPSAIARATSPGVAQRAMSAGRRSMSAFQTVRASS